MSEVRVSKKQALTALENIQDYGPMARIGAQNSFDQLESFVGQGPTHYAVIDEHGEIVHSSRVLSYRDAEKDCKAFLYRMAETHAEARRWTVKGVTAHQE